MQARTSLSAIMTVFISPVFGAQMLFLVIALIFASVDCAPYKFGLRQVIYEGPVPEVRCPVDFSAVLKRLNDGFVPGC